MRVLLAGLVFAACTGDEPVEPPPAPDAGMVDAAAGPPASPAALPQQPRLTPCPEGWRTVEETCDPYPESGPQDCAEDEAHFVGTPGCERVGSVCPSGDFPEDLPSDQQILYVLAGSSGGDGSRSRPFGRINEATAASAPRSIIAVGKGTYDEAIELSSGVTLWGACVRDTILTSTQEHATRGVLLAEPTGVSMVVRNLRFADSVRPGISLLSSRTRIHVEDVVIERATYGGIIAAYGQLTGTDIVVRDTKSGSDGSFGRGISVQYGAYVEIARAVFEGNREGGMVVLLEGSTLKIEDVLVRDTQVEVLTEAFGRGMNVQFGAVVEVNRGLLLNNIDTGVHVSDDGSHVTLTDVIIRETQMTALGELGRGLHVQAQAKVDLSRVLIDDNHEVGLITIHDAAVVAEDLVVRGTKGYGAFLGSSATASITRSLFDGNEDVGFHASETDGLWLTDITVQNTRELGSGRGRGLSLQEGASATVLRALLANNVDLGLFISTGGHYVLRDVTVRDTASNIYDGTKGALVWCR